MEQRCVARGIATLQGCRQGCRQIQRFAGLGLMERGNQHKQAAVHNKASNVKKRNGSQLKFIEGKLGNIFKDTYSLWNSA